MTPRPILIRMGNIIIYGDCPKCGSHKTSAQVRTATVTEVDATVSCLACGHVENYPPKEEEQ